MGIFEGCSPDASGQFECICELRGADGAFCDGLGPAAGWPDCVLDGDACDCPDVAFEECAWSWTVDGAAPVPPELAALVGDADGPTLLVRAEVLPPSTSWSFTVVARDGIGRISDPAGHAVQILSLAPSVSPVGASAHALFTIQPLALLARVQLACPEQSVAWRWAIDDPTVDLSGTVTPSLFLPARTLNAGDWTVTATATPDGEAGSAGQTTFALRVRLPDLVVAGLPASVVVLDGQELVLDGSDAFDPAAAQNPPPGATYTWSCARDGEDCGVALPPGPVLRIPAATLGLGEVVITLTFAVGERSAVGSTVVAVNPCSPPVVALFRQPAGKVNPSGSVVVVANLGDAIDPVWTIEPPLPPEHVVVAPNGAAVGLNPDFVEGALTPGTTYSVRLHVRGALCGTAQAVMEVPVNEPPSGGSCGVEVVAADQASTEVVVSCVDWQDPDAPLRYRFGAVTAGGILVWLTQPGQPSSARAELPPDTDSIVVHIFDALNLRVEVTLPFTNPCVVDPLSCVEDPEEAAPVLEEVATELEELDAPPRAEPRVDRALRALGNAISILPSGA